MFSSVYRVIPMNSHLHSLINCRLLAAEEYNEQKYQLSSFDSVVVLFHSQPNEQSNKSEPTLQVIRGPQFDIYLFRIITIRIQSQATLEA